MVRILAVGALAVSLLAPGSSRANGHASVTVRIRSFAYDPATIRVNPGTVVDWVNEDEEPHTVTSDHEVFGSRALEKGNRFAFTFARKGRFTYHCALHPQMTATVVVE